LADKEEYIYYNLIDKKYIMKSNIHFSILFLISTLCLSHASCKKENIAESDPCGPEIPEFQVGPILPPEFPTLVEGSFGGTLALVNPANPAEIIITARVDSIPTIVRYNMETKAMNTIDFGGIIYSRMSWGKTDWLVFVRKPDYNLYKIKSNGDSLTRITSETINSSFHHCEWDHSGTRIIASAGVTPNLHTFILDKNGTFLDTIPNQKFDGSYSWNSKESLIAGTEYGKFFCFNYNASGEIFDLKIFHNDPNDHSLYRCKWMDDKHLIWINGSGLYVTNIETSETTMVKENYSPFAYKLGSYSQQLDKIFLVKYYYWYDEECNFFGEGWLVTINPDGTGEEEIEIPQW
jgi:hypothetical protein